MNSFSAKDYQYMARAIALAKNGLYSTQTNPRVGCVLVQGEEIIGEGWHIRPGEGHAEVNALQACQVSPKGATAYVSLEPCSHQGKTPPCSDALIKAGVKRVVAAMKDPNPLVAGSGFSKLEAAGIEVQFGLLEAQARQLNPGFIRRMEGGLPFVRIKLACSLDGRIAMASGESKWITGDSARQDVQLLRARSGAIVTGAETVRMDNPSMNVRPAQCVDQIKSKLKYFNRQPLRVVLSGDGNLSPELNFFAGDDNALMVTPPDCAVAEQMKSVQVEIACGDDGKVDLRALLNYLGSKGINEVLVESGGSLAGQFLKQGLVDELWVYMAPIIMGKDAQACIGLSLSSMSDKLSVKLEDSRRFGQDTRLIYGMG